MSGASVFDFDGVLAQVRTSFCAHLLRRGERATSLHASLAAADPIIVLFPGSPGYALYSSGTMPVWKPGLWGLPYGGRGRDISAGSVHAQLLRA